MIKKYLQRFTSVKRNVQHRPSCPSKSERVRQKLRTARAKETERSIGRNLTTRSLSYYATWSLGRQANGP